MEEILTSVNCSLTLQVKTIAQFFHIISKAWVCLSDCEVN